MTSPTSNPERPDGRAPEAKRARRRRRIGLSVLVVLVLLSAAGVVLTRSPVTRWLVVPRLGAMTNTVLEAEGVTIGLDGRLDLEGVRMSIPGVKGPAGTFLKVQHLRAEFTWSSLLQGRPRVTGVTLDSPVVRLSQHAQTGSINIEGLALLGGGPDTGATPPTVAVRHGIIELGEHEGERFELLKRYGADGRLVASQNVSGSGYELLLKDLTTPGEPIEMHGEVSNKGVVLSMASLPLESWPIESYPTRLRELVGAMDVEGRVAGTKFRVAFPGAIEAEFNLDGVAMNLPFSADGRFTPGERGPRVHGVTGRIVYRVDSIHADLRGVIEDLPYSVTFDSSGVMPDVEFTCELVTDGFRLAERPKLLPFVPEVVGDQLARFSSPTATVNASVRIDRKRAEDAPDAPPEVGVRGRLELVDGVAAYRAFPYEFGSVQGVMTFDRDELRIVDLTGVAPSGATVQASGRIGPLGSEASVELSIRAERIPVDPTLEDALGARGRVIDLLFSAAQHETLLEQGLVLTPAQASALRARRTDAFNELALVEARGVDSARGEALRSELARIDRTLRTPEFAFRGLADVDVTLRRAPGPESNWSRRIEVHLPEAGLVPEQFPLPIRAHDVVLEIVDRKARLVSGRYEGLVGGSADVAATALLPPPTPDGPTVVPDLTIRARGIPIDDRVLHAIPGPVDRRATEGGLSIQQLVSRLGLAGSVDCFAYITQNLEGELDYDISVDIAGLSARPGPQDRPDAWPGAGAEAVPDAGVDEQLELADMSGTIGVTREHLTMNLEAALGVVRQEVRRESGLVEIDALFALGEPLGYEASVRGRSVDLSAPIEQAIELISPASAGAIRDAREAYTPTGQVDAETVLSGLGERQDAELRIDNVHSFEVGVLDGRMELSSSAGRLLVRPHEGVAHFKDFYSKVRFDGEDGGTLRLDGTTWLRVPEDPGEPPVLTAQLSNTRFESALVGRLVEHRLGDGARALRDRFEPRGHFDLLATFTPKPESGKTPPEMAASGDFMPKSLSVRRGGERVSLDELSGRVRFQAGDGEVESLQVGGPGWSASASGAWSYVTPERRLFEGEVTLDAQGVPDDLRALLPTALGEVMDRVGLRVSGPVSLQDGRVVLEVPDDGAMNVGVDGRVRFAGASAELGLEFTEADGVMDFDFDRVAGRDGRFDLSLALDRFRAAGVSMTGGRARVRSAADNGGGARGAPESGGGGSVLIPMLAASCHGGRLSGYATLERDEDGSRWYALELRSSDIRFAPVLDEMAGETPGEGEEYARSRGLLDGQMSLFGRGDDLASRRGRGSIRVSDGRVMSLPLVLPLIEVSNLQLPTNERLDYARGTFYVAGPVIAFEDLSAFSQSVSILGFGTVTWPDKALNLRFNSKAANRIPVISGVLEGIRDEFISTSVAGTLDKPDVKVEQFSGTRRVLARLLGLPETEQQALMNDIQRRAERLRQRQERVNPDRLSPDARVGAAGRVGED